MTPYEILTELAQVRKLPVAREVAKRAGATVICTDLLTLWDLANGECIKSERVKTRRSNLIKAGLMDSIRDDLTLHEYEKNLDLAFRVIASCKDFAKFAKKRIKKLSTK